jgi:hydrogenase expression/formation protein HypD
MPTENKKTDFTSKLKTQNSALGLQSSPFRDAGQVADLSAEIRELTAVTERNWKIMEICGTHTMSIYRYGIRQLLPPSISLISGPGCPVCVTPAGLIDAAIDLARDPKIILCSFGDMLRVPGLNGSLLEAQAEGASVRLVDSPLKALDLARENPEKEIVFFAVGFETTAPTTAAVIEIAAAQGMKNFFILPAHKTMPQALKALFTEETNMVSNERKMATNNKKTNFNSKLKTQNSKPGLQSSPVDALLCPGHVAAISGAQAFAFVPDQLGKPAAIAGFEPVDIMLALRLLVEQLATGKAGLVNAYPRFVTSQGNLEAQSLVKRVFQEEGTWWRGLGLIENSGLALRSQYRDFDGAHRFGLDLTAYAEEEPPGCRCGEVLRGRLAPGECPLMGEICNPENPVGPCMVSSEGSCAAYYRYQNIVKSPTKNL